MKRCCTHLLLTISLVLIAVGSAQTAPSPGAAAPSASTSTALPHLVRFSGIAKDVNGNPLTSSTSVTFALYSEQSGGSPLWLETQNVQPDSNGRYVVLLGVTKPDGLPANLFASEQARWLGIQISGQEEQPRKQLVSAPYAIKAVDAETVGGLAPSAFVLAPPANGGPSAAAGGVSATSASPSISGSGTKNYLPFWTSSTKLGTSALYQTTGSTPQIGINTTSPGAKLGVVGTGMFTTSTNGSVIAATQSGGTGNGVLITASGSPNPAVLGSVTASTGTTAGVEGTASGPISGYGVEGQNPSTLGWGVYGTAQGASSLGSSGDAAGVWGNTGAKAQSPYVGVMGTADDTFAAAFNNNCPDCYAFGPQFATLFMQDLPGSGAYPILNTYGATFGGDCSIYTNGSLSCTGTISSAVPVDGGVRKVALDAVLSSENWFEDSGSGELFQGSTRINLEPGFAQTVNLTAGYHVFLTPKGDCEGLYVSNETAQGFEVHELHGGHSAIAFDYRIVARRNGYENVRLADVTERFNRQETVHQAWSARLAGHGAARQPGK